MDGGLTLIEPFYCTFAEAVDSAMESVDESLKFHPFLQCLKLVSLLKTDSYAS